MRRSFLLIENPAAGLRKHRLLAACLAELEARRAKVVRVPSAHPGHATQIAADTARRGQVDALIVAGGDGSIREAAKGLLGTSMPLGFIPSGTGNVLANEIGLVRRPDAIAAYLMYGHATSITPSLANGEPFILMAGAGFDAAVVAMLDPALKQRFGQAAYAGPVLRALLQPIDTNLDIATDAGGFAASWVIATHASRYGGRMRLTGNTSLLHAQLEVIGGGGTTRLRRALQLAGLPFGKLHAMRGVKAALCRRATVKSADATPVPVQIDGDLMGTTPLTIEPGTQSFRLMLPETL